jgi:methenyltetrahydromethanopterin cyclohydrolase
VVRRVEQSQPLAWPRTGQDAAGLPFSGTPAQVVDCEVLLTGAHEAGPLCLTGGNSDRQVCRETADDASIEYLTSASRHFTIAVALITPFAWRVSFSGYRQVMGARG